MNNINQIAYAVEIRTDSTKSSANVGLFEGVFRFTTNNYDMNNAVDEDSNPIANSDFWYKDFITEKGLSSISSQINITVGGDQAYLSSATVQLVNYTALGYRYHDALKDISGLYTIAADMIIYVIIDNVMYQRWTGKVGSTTLTDSIFKWNGIDKNNDVNITISDKIFGYVSGAPAKYTGIDESIWKNLLISDFGAVNTIKAGYSINYNLLRIPYLFGDEFTGFVGLASVAHVTYLLPNTSERYVSCENGENAFGNVAINDYVTFNEDEDMYVIREINGGQLVLDALDSSLVDYTNMFRTNPDSRYSEVVKISLTDTEGSNTLSIWKQRSLNIKLSDIPDDDTITITHENGESSTVNYSVTDAGNIILGRQVTTTKISPDNVKYFNSDVELFNDTYKTPDDKWYDSIDKTTVILDNTLNISGSFVEFSGSYNYFEIDFDSDIDVSDYSFSLMLKGVFNDTIENWQQEMDDNQGWDSCTGQTWGDGTEPAYGRMTYANNAKDIAERTAEIFTVKVFKLSNVVEIGSIPILIDIFEMPNARKVPDPIRYNYIEAPWDPQARINFSMEVTSVPVTNIPYYGGDVLSTYDKTIVQQNGTEINNLRLPITSALLPESDSDIQLNNGSKYLIQITGNNIDTKYLQYTDTNSVTTQRVENELVEDCVFTLNGFALTSTEATFDNSGSFNYVANVLETNTYPKVVEALVGTKDNIVGRDSWVTGRYVSEPTPKHNLVTSLMKQGFVAGWINRFGNYKFKTFLEDFSGVNHIHNDDIILSNTAKKFTLTDSSKIYNEFNIKWNYSEVESEYKNELILKNADQDFFPAEAGNWTDYVSGIPSYANAKAYWTQCHIAYLTNKTINKAPSDRTELEWAVDDSDDKPIPLGTGSADIVLDATIDFEVGSTAFLHWDEPLLIDNIVTLKSLDSGYSAVVRLLSISNILDNVIRRFEVELVEYDGPADFQFLNFDSVLSTVSINVNTDWLSRGEYSAYINDLKGMQSDTVVDFGLSVTGEYFDKTVNIGDTLSFDTEYTDPSASARSISFKVKVDSIVSIPDIDILDPQGNWTGTVIEIGTYFDDYRPPTVVYFPRKSSFVYQQGIEDLEGYPWEYLVSLVNWTTYQKYQVNYSLPITAETIKYELVDNVTFNDPIITPDGQVGKGWITKYVLDPKKNIINVQITFEPAFLVKASIPVCEYINEEPNNSDTITEDVNNVDTITEQHCIYN